MSRYYQPVSEEVRSLPITCHAGTQSESGYSPSQTLTLELDGGGGCSRPRPSFTLGKAGANSYTNYATPGPSEKVIYRNLKQALAIIFIIGEIG